MHVAMIGQKGIPARIGGIERHVEELSARLARLGMEVTVYTRPWYTAPGKRKYRGVNLVSLPSIHTKYLDAITHTLAATIHAILSEADVIHYHGVGPALLAWLPRIFAPGKRVVVTFHCIDRRHEKWGFIGRAALAFGEIAACKFSHETIAVSRTLQHYAQNLYRSRVRYIPNGVSVIEEGSFATLRDLGLAPGGYLLVVTRFVRHKGVHTVLAAWEKIQDLPFTKKLELVLVGGASFTDSYADAIASYAGRLKRVRLLGVKEGRELASLYRYARLFVHASVSEGLPLVILEAMAHGAPVLASNIPEHMELVAEHGWHFRADDPSALAREIRNALRSRLPLARAKDAKRFVANNFSWDDIAKDTVSLYHNLYAAPKKMIAEAL